MRHKLHAHFFRLRSSADESFRECTPSQQYKQGAIQLSLINLFTDGGCRGNPGPGAIGIVIFDSANNLLYEHSECIGNTTNNRAEYLALIKGLDLCAKFSRKKICCYCDSELVVNQMNGAWRLKNDELRELFHKVTKNAGVFREVVFQHVNRTNQNIKKADKLLNDAFEGRCVARNHSKE